MSAASYTEGDINKKNAVNIFTAVKTLHFIDPI
jgi:hypothetical protein